MRVCVWLYSLKILFDVIIVIFDMVMKSTPPFIKPHTPTTFIVYRRIIDIRVAYRIFFSWEGESSLTDDLLCTCVYAPLP